MSIFLALLFIFLSYPSVTSFAVNRNLLADPLYDCNSQDTSCILNVDVFSDLSRNMTASSSFSSDLFGNDTFPDPGGTAGNIESNSEEEEAVIDSNETSSSESFQSPSDLSGEENEATGEGQVQEKNIQGDTAVDVEQDKSTVFSELPTEGEDEQNSNPINDPDKPRP